MSSRFVRSSKFRHVFGKAGKKELCYDNLRVSRAAWDTNKVDVNSKYVAFIWEAGGGGSFGVVNQETTGKLAKVNLVSGHKAPVLDIAFNPFNDSLIASGSEDATVKIWSIPEGGLTENISEPVQNLVGHRRKVGTVEFNPTAENVLATSSTDYKVKIWDIEKGDNTLTVDGHSNIIPSCVWNRNGSLLASTSKDKKLRIVDPRQNKFTQEVLGHQGTKGSRACFLGNEKLLTVGFSRSSERELFIWDIKDMSKHLTRLNIDTSSGVLMPFFDFDTSVFYLAGKGDGNVRYYEHVDDDKQFYYLSEYKSSQPCIGMGMLPKYACDIASCEVVRLYKAHGTLIEPISFQVPRKSDLFQDDLFPPTRGPECDNSAADWLAGKDSEGKTINLEDGFTPKASTKEFKPVVKEVPTGPQGEKELREEYEKQLKRITYLEAELLKRDAKIKELEGK